MTATVQDIDGKARTVKMKRNDGLIFTIGFDRLSKEDISLLETVLKESADNKISENNLSDDTEKVASPLHQDLAKERELDDEVSNVDDFSDEEDDKFEQPKIISQTLGEILVSQQKYAEAKAVFEALKEKQPDTSPAPKTNTFFINTVSFRMCSAGLIISK